MSKVTKKNPVFHTTAGPATGTGPFVVEGLISERELCERYAAYVTARVGGDRRGAALILKIAGETLTRRLGQHEIGNPPRRGRPPKSTQ